MFFPIVDFSSHFHILVFVVTVYIFQWWRPFFVVFLTRCLAYFIYIFVYLSTQLIHTQLSTFVTFCFVLSLWVLYNKIHFFLTTCIIAMMDSSTIIL